MASDTGFNLLDEPWIAILEPTGAETQVSMLDLFERAAHLVAISGDVPTQVFAITRLLLAFLHRAIDGPKDQREWGDLWRADALPMGDIRRYADGVRPRFDLYDDKAPFFQAPGLRTKKGEVSGLEKIVADVPNGEPLFTTRSAASLARIDSAEAARWLVHVHAFDPSGIKSGAADDPKAKNGKGYPIGTGWSGQLGGVLPEGRNLRETLLLNLISYDMTSYVNIGGPNDRPPWEREPDTGEWHDERSVGGATDLYTWQTRRVRLVGGRAGVTGVVLANGDKILPHNRHAFDPHTAWRYSDPQTKKRKELTYLPRMHDPQRAVWRGLAAMLPSVSGRRRARGDETEPLAPGVLQWISDLVGEGELPRDYVVRTRVIGAEYGSQNATFTEIIDDSLAMAVILLQEDAQVLGHAAEQAATDVDKVAGSMWYLAENIARAAGAEPKVGFGDRARQALYAALDQPYRAWLANLGPETDATEARAAWQRTVLVEAGRLAHEQVESAGPAAWIGREINGDLVNVALAERAFRRGVRKALSLALPAASKPDQENNDDVDRD